MKNLSEIRKEYPQYNDMSDVDLADSLHSKFYSDIPKKTFYKDVGLKPKTGWKAVGEDALKGAKAIPGAVWDMAKHLPKEGYGVAKQIYNLAHGEDTRLPRNLLAGSAEGVRGLLNAPANVIDYLREKEVVPEWLQAARPSENFNNFDIRNAVGLEGEQSGDLLLYGIGSYIPNSIAGGPASALALQAIGQNENPVTAGLLPYGIKGASRGLGYGVKGAQKAFDSTLKEPILSARKRITGKPTDSIAADIIQPDGLSPAYESQILEAAKKRTDAANFLDVPLTPAEATGSPLISQNQATAGRTKKGAAKLEEFYRGEEGKYAKENKAVSNFFEELGVDSENVSAETARNVRDTAGEIIQEQVQNRKKLSHPVYKKAKKDTITNKTIDNLMNDEVILDAAQKVVKDAPYREAIKNVNKNSVEYWDLVKKRIDGEIERAGGDLEKIRLLNISKAKLTTELDKASPKYAKARQLFGSESEVLEELRHSNLGKLSRLKDTQLKNVSQILFDPREIDPTTLNTVRSRLLKQNKKVYYDALAQNMRSKMDTIARSATNRDAPAFYKAILQTDKVYDSYRAALKHNPKALRRLEAMKEAFADLGGDFTPKTAAGLEKTGMTNPRDLIKGLTLKLIKGGKYDEAAVEFITNPKWIDTADKILARQPSVKRSVAIAALLNKIGGSKKTAIVGASLKEKEKTKD